MDKIISRREFLFTSFGFIGSVILGGCVQFSKNGVTKIDIFIKDQYRIITTNGYPNHPIGNFPNKNCPYSVGYQEEFSFKVPLNPVKANSIQSIYDRYIRFGVALNGVPFDPAGPAWDIEGNWHFEVLSKEGKKYLGVDQNNAHVQPYDRPGGPSEKYGEYHYHGFPKGLFKKLAKITDQDMVLVGYSADGYPIYISKNDKFRSSYRLKRGKRTPFYKNLPAPQGNYDGTFVEDYEFVKNSGDLDMCNGRYGITKEYPKGTFYYMITKEFPYIPRCFYGKVDKPKGMLTMRNMNFYHPKAPGVEQTPKVLREYPRASEYN
jgi:hypothetical protein